jgi:hypothetical protein
MAIEAAGGFHPDGFPREMIRFRGDGETHVTNVIRNRGWTTIFDSEASVHHHVPLVRMTRAYFEERAFAQGISDSFAAVRRYRGHSFGLRHRTESLLRSRIKIARELWHGFGFRSDVIQRELLEIRLATLRAWVKGYTYHQSAIREDAGLLSWVLKEGYLT